MGEGATPPLATHSPVREGGRNGLLRYVYPERSVRARNGRAREWIPFQRE